MKPLFLFLLILFSMGAWALPNASTLSFRGSVFSLFTSQNLTTKNSLIEKVIITIHGSERNASTYYKSIATLAKQLGVSEKTLIIAPHFKELQDELLPNELSFHSEGWLRGDVALNNSSVSSFEILDLLVKHLGDKNTFPNLKNIVLAGHSAGGQTVQRYAGGSEIDELYPHINFRYVVTNPGSYLYMTKNRPFTSDQRCAFNDYKFGLDNLNSYMQRYSSKIVTRYISKEIVYFVGEGDTRSDDIDQSCPAQYQGHNRLERGRAYKEQLDREFPFSKHTLITVPEVGHTQYGMYTSDLGKKVLFE